MDRLLQGEGLYVNKMHNIAEKHFNISIDQQQSAPTKRFWRKISAGKVKVKVKNTLLNLGMNTYSCERQVKLAFMLSQDRFVAKQSVILK
jgi:ABC-type transporter lipoprotein component MlaA